jgi:serine/threonine-protein kinase
MSSDDTNPSAKAPSGTPPGSDEATILASHTTIGRSLPGGGGTADGSGGARQVGRYRILEKLGEGAMATVYRAHDPSIDRQLVIKFLHADLCVDPEYRGRFLREARAAGVLSHPNIVTVFDVGEIEGRPYIAMELLDGGPLSERVTEGQGMPVREVLDIGVQLASALHYAHSRGVVHRDIKPSNIMCLKDGRTIKVADFGIAHVESRESGDKTRVGTVMGTPHYMSPEQALGMKADARSDLFAAGVVLYQLLAGRRPFEADNMVKLLFKIAKDDPEPLDRLRKDVPAALRRVVVRCLAKQADKRFQTGEELGAALRKVRQDLDAEEAAGQGGAVRRIPLKVKLALVMAVVVAVTMALTSAFVSHRQYQTMLHQTVEQGASLTRLIAAESATPALSDDWVGIDVFVQEVAKALEAKGLSVVDRAGVVRVSTDAAAVGQPQQAIQGERIATRDATVAVQRYQGGDGEAAFAFEVPIKFQDKRVGTVRLALPETPLAAVANESRLLMALLALITAATAMLATYLLVERYSKPLRLLRESLDEIARGRYEYRIAEPRKDELGEIYRAFDAMAAKLEEKAAAGAGAGSPAAAPGPGTVPGAGAASAAASRVDDGTLM